MSEGKESQPSTSGLIICRPKPVTTISLGSYINESNDPLKNKVLTYRILHLINPLTPNDPYSCRTAPLTSKRYILYIYSTIICTEYFKHGIYSSSKCSLFHNSNLYGSCFIHILYTVCAKIKKKIIPAP